MSFFEFLSRAVPSLPVQCSGDTNSPCNLRRTSPSQRRSGIFFA